MLNTIAKRVQTRLSKQGVKVSLPDIRPVVEQMINDINNPTDQEVLSVVDHFLYNATKLTVINEDIATEELTEVEETLTHENVDIVNTVDSVHTPSIQDIDSSTDNVSISNLDDNIDDLAIATASTKSEIIATAAETLGIQLSTAEIDQIADNFDAGSDDFTQTLEQVKGAIIAYVQHKIASNNQRIVNTINEISQVASNGFEENSQTLSDGLKHLNQQLIQQSADFKSKLTGTLSRFQLPAAS